MVDSGEITQLLSAARRGDRGAMDRVVSLVYEEIRRIARRQSGRVGRSYSLDTTAVVHEAYLKLAGAGGAPWEDRAHFLNVAAMAIRQVLVDHARTRARKKRGGGVRPFLLDETEAPIEERAAEILELDAALSALSRRNERLARVVELRFFAGLSVEETGRVLGISERTVKRDWRAARAYLYRELSS